MGNFPIYFFSFVIHKKIISTDLIPYTKQNLDMALNFSEICPNEGYKEEIWTKYKEFICNPDHELDLEMRERLRRHIEKHGSNQYQSFIKEEFIKDIICRWINSSDNMESYSRLNMEKVVSDSLGAINLEESLFLNIELFEKMITKIE